MEGIKVDIDEEISLWITGNFVKGEPENNIPDSFEIDSIESLTKDIYYLLEYFNNSDIINELSELALEEYNNQL